MAALLNTIVFDSGLTDFHARASTLTLTSQQADSFSHARTAGAYELGIATPGAGDMVSAPMNDAGNGRQVTLNAIAQGGSINAEGVAGFWAVTDGSSILFAAYGVGQAMQVFPGNSFNTGSCVIDVRGVVSP